MFSVIGGEGVGGEGGYLGGGDSTVTTINTNFSIDIMQVAFTQLVQYLPHLYRRMTG